jgi:hypothetical protein
MTSLDPRNAAPGFQRSEKSSAELILYGQPSNPGTDQQVLPLVGDRIEFKGRSERDPNPSLLSLSTSKALGAPSGTWQATVKTGRPLGRDIDLRDLVIDDQWADIVFRRYNRPYAVMRGSVDRIQRMGGVGGAGASTSTYSIVGRDFGKIWEKTPLWFNQFANENVVGAAALQVIDGINTIGDGSVETTVAAFLFGFLQALAGKGRANWLMPIDMPGVADGSAFTDNVFYDTNGFSNSPERRAVSPSFMDPAGAGAWAMAQQWSDPAFCELWVDFVPTLGPFGTISNSDTVQETIVAFGKMVGVQLAIEDAAMTVILRDRPFPTRALGSKSPWFDLPTAYIPQQEIISNSLTRGGDERFNAFFVSPQILQGFLLSGQVDITAPLWDPDDMKVHGFRRFDINSPYIARVGESEGALLSITKQQREKVRDWHCLNPYLWNGSVQLGHGRPDIRVGMRVKIPGFTRDKDLTAYIEQVDHSWSLRSGIKTTLGLTRGWFGSDESYLEALDTVASRYTEGL